MWTTVDEWEDGVNATYFWKMSFMVGSPVEMAMLPLSGSPTPVLVIKI